MKKFIYTTVFAAFFVFLAGGLTNIYAQKVSVSGNLGSVKRGGSTKGTITISIPGNQHINSSRPGSEYAIPTSVKLSATGAKVSGAIYPRGRNKKFPFSEDAINVYTGSATFSFTVTVPSSFKGKSIRVRAVVRYQACTDEVCYPPKSETINLTATVK